MPLAPTLSLLLVYLTYWLVCRLYGWRATLGPGTFLMFFTFGTVGSVLFALYAEAIHLPFPLEEGTGYAQVDPRTWLTGPALEEVAKILPLLVIVAFVPAARRLSIADFVLMGFTTGLGFGFVEANFGRVLSADISSWGNILAFGYAIGTPQAQYLTYSTGHEVAPALVGLGLGIGVRFSPDRYWKWLPGAVMFLYGAFDHSMWNFKQQHQYPNSADLAPPLIESLYRFTMHGYLAILLLPIGIIVVTFLEGHWSWLAVPSPESLRLPDEQNTLYGEAKLLFDRRTLGPGAIMRTLTYFRHRRAYALAASDAPPPEAAAFAELSRRRLLGERELSAAPIPSPWMPTGRGSLRFARTVFRRYGAVLAVTLLMLLLFAFAPTYFPWLHGRTFALIVVLASAAFTAWRIVRFLRAPMPEPRTSDGEMLTAYRTRAIMLATSAVATTISLLSLGLGRKALIPGAVAYISAYVGNWTQAGGAIDVLIAGGGASTAVTPPGKPPCEDLQHEADAGAEKVKALESNLNRLINGLSSGRPPPGTKLYDTSAPSPGSSSTLGGNGGVTPALTPTRNSCNH